MRSFRKVLSLHVRSRMGFVNITSQVAAAVEESGVREGLCLVNSMHITSSVFINDDEPGLHEDYARWLEHLAPYDPSPERYHHNRTGEDNGDAHHKRQVMGREVLLRSPPGDSTSARGSRFSTASSTATAPSACSSRSSANSPPFHRSRWTHRGHICYCPRQYSGICGIWAHGEGGVSMWGRLRRLSPRDVERDRAVLTEVVRRIVQVAQPDQVILFGSAARGRLRPDSDFDLLVIKSGVPDTRVLKRQIYAHLFGIRMPIDVIVATPEDVQAAQFKMLGRIYAEGRRLYPSPQNGQRWNAFSGYRVARA